MWGSAKSTQFYYVMLHAMGGVLLSSYPSKIIFSPHWCGYNAAINAAKCGEMRLIIKHKVNTTKTRSPLYGHLSDSSFHVLVRLDLLYTNITSKHTSRHKKRKFQKSRILRPAHFTEELLVITYYIFSRIKESRNQGIKDYAPNLHRPSSTFALLYSSSFCEKWYFDRDPSCSYGRERSPNFFNCFS